MTRPPTRDSSSRLQKSLRSGFNLLSALLYLLALVLGVAAVLSWTIDESANALQGGWILLGLCLAVLLLGLFVQWLAGRPAPASAAQDTSPTPVFHRVGLGRAWTDWFALLVPFVVLSPTFWVSTRPIAESGLAVLALGGFLDVLILPALLTARREWVSLKLHPAGMVLETRGGRVREVRRGELLAVRLDAGHVRGFAFGVVALDLREGEPVTLREPMSRPLPQLARAVADHMGVPLLDQAAPGAPT